MKRLLKYKENFIEVGKVLLYSAFLFFLIKMIVLSYEYPKLSEAEIIIKLIGN